jgi:large subunit ribosomal protein L1
MSGKKYQSALKQIDREKLYTPSEALALLKQIAGAKFDETVELHLRLGIDPRHSDQQVRSTVLMPHGLGKTVRVLVFAEGEAARIAQNAGADFIGDDEMIARIEKEGFTDFDVALATPDMMKKVGKLGKVLGRKGLMPNPKAGTVVAPEDIPRAMQEARAGRIEFRNDKTANLHIPIGKVSFPLEHLQGNMAAAIEAIIKNKPSAAKGRYIRRIVLASTMSPGIRVDISSAETMF